MPAGAESTHKQSGTARGGLAGADVVLDAMPAAVLVTDRAGRITYRNARANAWFPDGQDVAGTLGSLHVLSSADERPAGNWTTDDWNAALRALVADGAGFCVEAAVPGTADVPARLVTVRAVPLRESGSNHARGVILILMEGARRESAPERAEVAQRLTSLGKLATRVAHELNNPLDGILRYVNLSLRLVDEAPESKLQSYLTESRTGLMRMVQIIGDLLEYARSTGGSFESAPINELVDQAIRANASAANDVGVVVTADYQTPEMPSVSGSRLFQVCCNLIKNAIDAMPDGGRLSITCGVVKGEVVIRVADTGPGLPDPPEKVFEPFFTTKAAGSGTGLGLAICRDFIEEMKGSIQAGGQPQGGAVLTVRLPLSSCLVPNRLTATGG